MFATSGSLSLSPVLNASTNHGQQQAGIKSEHANGIRREATVEIAPDSEEERIRCVYTLYLIFSAILQHEGDRHIVLITR